LPAPDSAYQEDAIRDVTRGSPARLATDPGSVKDFEAFARQTGNELLSSVEANKVFEYYLKRK
jgi:tRNA 2-thiouridine synthesizing protein A